LPRQNSGEPKKHRDKEPEAAEKVPIGPIETQSVKMNGTHQAKNRVSPPLRIVLAKAECMPGSEEHEKDRSDSIKKRSTHLLASENDGGSVPLTLI
jgi:hypothetical protein